MKVKKSVILKLRYFVKKKERKAKSCFETVSLLSYKTHPKYIFLIAMEASIIDGESQNVITNPITVMSVISPRKEKPYTHKHRSKI